MIDKTVLRSRYAAARAEAAQSGGDAARALADRFSSDGPDVAPGQVVAGYWPIRSELSVRPLMDALITRGVEVALPFAGDRDAALEFRGYEGGVPAGADVWGIPSPGGSAAILRPDIVLVPGLAFDRDGHRLGYGAGHYDRTLAALRTEGPVIAVGICYDAQVVDGLPREDHDREMDWIISPTAIIKRP